MSAISQNFSADIGDTYILIASGYDNGGLTSISGATVIASQSVPAVSGTEPNAVQLFTIKATSNTVSFKSYGCAAIVAKLQ